MALGIYHRAYAEGAARVLMTSYFNRPVIDDHQFLGTININPQKLEIPLNDCLMALILIIKIKT